MEKAHRRIGESRCDSGYVGKRYQILGRRERNLKTLNPTEYTPLFKAG